MDHSQTYTNSVPLLQRAQGAFLAAAVGDALGWPNEDRSRRIKEQRLDVQHFQRWIRRAGGRYFPHDEMILPGEYSDDTQLLLCSARSLLQGRVWWSHLSTVELPLWTVYERGGGRATKRAADSWLAGKSPWSHSSIDEIPKRYFEAGGNGVAMRIMPHVIPKVGCSDFNDLAASIMADGVITHGHPRSLVGALAFGYALWCTFRQHSTLQYGELIDLTIQGRESWSSLPDIAMWCPDWYSVAEKHAEGRYEEIWRTTSAEILALLEHCRTAMKQGALAVDREVLAKLGCFNREVSGAGTVAGAAAIFLASRYAVDPVHGLVEPAFTQGIDTDTIASMTGAILGALRGTDWLGEYVDTVQDAKYLRVLAEHLVHLNYDNAVKNPAVIHARKPELERLILELESSRVGHSVVLPDSRQAQLSERRSHPSRGASTKVVSWKLLTHDGQTIYVKRLSRQSAEDRHVQAGQRSTLPFPDVNTLITKVGVKIPVRDIAKSREFYTHNLGLKATSDGESFVKLNDVFLLVSADHNKEITAALGNEEKGNERWRTIISLETPRLDQAYEKIRQSGARVLTPITSARGRRFFRCIDPDENVIEVIESRSKPSLH